MMGRSLWRDPPIASTCSFRVHRMGVPSPQPRLPSHIQRRFLQTTKPAAWPPANAATMREERSYDDRGYSDSSAGLGTGLPPTKPSGGNWTRPALGNPATSTPTPKSFNFSRPTFGSSRIELTEEEKRVADLIKEKDEKQNVGAGTMFGGPAKESHRSERCLSTIEEKREATESKLTRAKLDFTRRRWGNAPGVFTGIRKHGKRILLEDEESPKTKEITEFETTQNWRHLRQQERGPNSSDNVRARRELSATDTKYIPVTGLPEFRVEGTTSKRARPMKMIDEFKRPREPNMLVKSGLKPSFDAEPVIIPVFETVSVANSSRTIELAQKETKMANQTEQVGGQTSVHYKPMSSSSMENVKDATNSQLGTRGSQYQPKTFGLSGVRPPGVYRRSEVEETDANRRVQVDLDREARAKKRAKKYAAEEVARSERQFEASKDSSKEKYSRRERFVAEYEEGEEQSITAKAELKRQKKREKAARKAASPTPVLLPEYITVANLALALKVRIENFVEKMEELGFKEIGYDFILNSEDAGLIAQEYNFEPLVDKGETLDLKAHPVPEDLSILPSRAPVVTIMGHVDHGKTTLLDYLRKSSVASSEHGGITQHIGAFSVPMPSGKVITFLDTPGHAAFLNMRQRGANVTDIIILVVAADDSVKPQTVEAISHAKAAKVPIIVAINKVDKEEANIEKVKQDLARHGVDVEDFGGDTQVVCVSGKTGQGMAELEDAAVTLSEILDLRAEIDGPAEGWILEASIKPMGKVATVLVRRGTMRPGDFIVAGKTWARIRCLRNEAGMDIEEAGPGMPVEIHGWKEQPLAGDEFLQAPTEQKAKSVIDYRNVMSEREKLAADMEAINDSRKKVQDRREAGKLQKLVTQSDYQKETGAKEETPSGPKQIQFIIKGDVSGSVEAVIDSIAAIGTAEVQAHVLRSGVGQISEFDIEHAAAACGYLINFNTAIEPKMSQLAEAAKVKIIDHNIIYRLMDDVKAELSKNLPPLVTQRVLGEADVAQVFEISLKGRKHKAVAGCKIRNGVVARNAKVRVMRNGENIFDGNLSSLKNLKKDVPEIRKGNDCGMGFENWTDFQIGDQIQSYEVVEEKRFL